MVWKRIENGKVQIKIGAIYMPQESRTKLDVLQEIYKEIEKEVVQAKEKGDSIIIMGDLNCKIGSVIKGNKEDISKGGRLLLKMVKKHSMKIVNAEESCNGLWTRVQGEEKSVIDYMIVFEEDLHMVQKMEIDEEKDITPYYVDTCGDKEERKYTDHCMITMKMDVTLQVEVQPSYVRILDEKGCSQFRKELQEQNVSKIIAQDKDIRQSYREWNEKVLKIRDRCSKKVKIRKQWKGSRKLSSQKKQITRELKNMTDKDKIKRLKEMKLHLSKEIEKEEQKKKFARIEKTVAEIKENGGINSNTFWEVRRKLTNKTKETGHSIMDAEGRICENIEDIKNVYSEWYKQLLTTRPAETVVEKQAEEIISHAARSMETIASSQAPRITTMKEIEDVVNKLNPKKAKDSSSWKNSLIKEGGKEMNISLKNIVNEVDRQRKIPNEWEIMEILATHKRGEKMWMSNKRGLFLTNNISKVYERVVKERNAESFRKGITEWQTGGVKERAPIDIIFTTTSIIEQNKYLKKPTYVMFTDAEKCFDKLWLDDGVYELWRCGTDVRDCMMIKKLNEKAEVIVRTPVGNTKPFTLENIVRQGTVYGPQICIASMDKINLIGKDIVTYYGPELPIRAGVFVDDVNGAGEVTTANNVIYNCNVLEERKKMTFSIKNGKTEYMVIGTTSQIESITRQVKSGRVDRVTEHKALGTWFDESGDYGINIKKNKEKLPFMIHTTRRESNPENVGTYAVDGRLKLAETVVIPSLIYNAEAFPAYKESEIKELERMQLSVLVGILEIPTSTPYYPLLLETGWWTMEARLSYKKLMFYHNILRSDDRRVIKKLLEYQQREDRATTWYGNIMKVLEAYNISLQPKNSSKSKWKKHVKTRIAEVVGNEIKRRCKEMKKGRTVKNDDHAKKDYLTKTSVTESKKILKARLHMSRIPANYKGGTEGECPLCEDGIGNIEHYFTCTACGQLADAWQVEKKDLNSKDLNKMKDVANFMEKVEILLNPSNKYEKPQNIKGKKK